MKNESIKAFQKKKKNILELWMKHQLANESLRDDLMSNDELRSQSDEILNALLTNLSDVTIDDPNNAGFEQVADILNAISISRAKQGFTPRETGAYVLSLKDALSLNLTQLV